MNQENQNLKKPINNWKTINVFLVLFFFFSFFDLIKFFKWSFKIEPDEIITDLTYNLIYSLFFTLICFCIRKYLFKNPHHLLSVSLTSTLVGVFYIITWSITHSGILNYYFKSSTVIDFLEPFLAVFIFAFGVTAFMLVICNFLYNPKIYFKHILGYFVGRKTFKDLEEFPESNNFSDLNLFQKIKKHADGSILYFYSRLLLGVLAIIEWMISFFIIFSPFILLYLVFSP